MTVILLYWQQKKSFIMKCITKNTAILLLILIIVTCKVSSDPEIPEGLSFRNGDFEEGDNFPDNWTRYPESASGMTYLLDSTEVFSGEKSLKVSISDLDSIHPYYGARIYQIITDFPSDKIITFSGYIKTENITEGTVTLAIALRDKDLKPLGWYQTEEAINETKPWEKHTVIQILPSTTLEIYVYIIHDGNGTAWFDDFTVTYE